VANTRATTSSAAAPSPAASRAQPAQKATAAGHAAAAPAAVGRGWAAELKELRLLLESPARTSSGAKPEGPSCKAERILCWTRIHGSACLQGGHVAVLLSVQCIAVVPAFIGLKQLVSNVPATACSFWCVSAAERGPSAGKEWFWLLNNPRLDPGHLLPTLTAPATPGSSSSSSGSSRPWRSVWGCWWEPAWNLGAVSLHAWPAHRDRMRAMAVDPGERWVVTAGGLRHG
jgi:hypothetical protein